LEAIAGRDLSNVSHFCDVGGGHGHLLCSLLAKHPKMRGTVVERAEVLEDPTKLWAKKMNVADRCEYAAGDMFAGVPSADAYILKHIIHDWNDEESVQILSNVRKVASPNARVFVAEYVVPGPETPHFAKLFDIHMLCWGTGRERTSEEYARLLDRAGWKYVDTLHPPVGAIAVVEGAKSA
ncbi:MAG: methyltransferase, partial [Candidatus Binatia bacterium]